MKKIIPISIIIILLIAVAYVVVNDLKEIKKTDVVEESLPIDDKCLGYIEGSLSYPSEMIPDMYVCAKNIDTMYEYCTDQNIIDPKYRYEKGYRLEVPIGNYQVAALLPQSINGNGIQEFKHVSNDCGKNDQECHATLAVIKVNCDKTIDNVDIFGSGKFDFFKRFDMSQYHK